MNDKTFDNEIGKMKDCMSPSDITLYAGMIVMGADGHDLDLLLTRIFLAGKQAGLDMAKEIA